MESFQRPLRTTGQHRTGHSLRVGISHKKAQKAHKTPKAFANSSPGLERKRTTLGMNQGESINPARVCLERNPYRVSIHRLQTPGLKLANAFGVF